MLDLFKTAAGGYNWVLLFSVIAWLPSTGVIVSNFIKHRTEVAAAHNAAKLSEKQNKEQERLRIEADRLREKAEKRLAAAEKKIVELTPLPLPKRICAILNRMNPAILEELKGGKTEFHGEYKNSDIRDLETIVKEAGANMLLAVQIQGYGLGSDSMIIFKLSPKLLEE